jgi:hypothetical protein
MVFVSLQTSGKKIPPLKVLIPIFFWPVAIFVGYVFTAFLPMDSSNWRLLVASRIVLQLGSTMWLFCAITITYGTKTFFKKFLNGALTSLFLGVVFFYNPVLDLVRGTQRLEGAQVVENNIVMGWAHTGSKIGGHPTYVAKISFRDTLGRYHRVNLKGEEVNTWDEFWKKCTISHTMNVDVIYLKHLNNLLHFACKE